MKVSQPVRLRILFLLGNDLLGLKVWYLMKFLIFANMKTSRFIAVICIYVASLFLLAHAILPHCNHSEEDVCIAYEGHNHCDGKECGDSHNHGMACHGESNGCILTKIIPHHNTSSEEILPDISDSNVDLLFCTCLLELLYLDIPSEVLEHKFWDEQSYYTSYISPTLGLRAPPIV